MHESEGQSTPALQTISDRLDRELRMLAVDLAEGPGTLIRAHNTRLFGEFRQDALRSLRRLTVLARETDDKEAQVRSLRMERARLAQELRGRALAHAARGRREPWDVALVQDAIARLVAAQPESLMQAVPAQAPRDGWEAWRLFWYRAGLASPPMRRVPVRQWTRSVIRTVQAGLEGASALFVRAEMEVADRLWSAYLALSQVYVGLEGRPIEAWPDFSGLRRQLEAELELALEEQEDMLRDARKRFESHVEVAVRRLTESFASGEPPPRTEAHDSSDRLTAARAGVSAGLSMTALRLELSAYEARVEASLDALVHDMAGNVRGRAQVQMERVESSLRDALDRWRQVVEASTDLVDAEESFGEELAVVDRVVREAGTAAEELTQALSTDALVAPILDLLAQEAARLTDRYSVPTERMARADHRVPDGVPEEEVAFARLVAAYVQRVIAPEVIAQTETLAKEAQSLANSLGDLGRLVSFDLEVVGTRHGGPVGESSDLLLTSLERQRAAVAASLATSRAWPERLCEGVLVTVREGMAGLREEFVAENIVRLKDRYLRGSDRALARVEAASAVDAGPRAPLHPTRDESTVSRASAGLRLSVACPDLPATYQSLFSTATKWAAGDPEVEQAAIALDRAVHEGGRGVMGIVGGDRATRRFLVNALEHRRERGALRQVGLSGPMQVDDVDRLFKRQAQVNVLLRPHWLFSGPRPDPWLKFWERASRSPHTWLVLAPASEWAFAMGRLGLDAKDARQFRPPPMGPASLQFLLKRFHQVSGYRVGYWAEGRRGRHLLQREGGAERRFFRALGRASGGSRELGLRLWRAAIERVDDERALVVMGPIPRLAMSSLPGLPFETLLRVFAVARCGWMSAEGYAKLSGEALGAARSELDRVTALGLLVRSDRGYTAAEHLEWALTACFESKGWLSP